MFGFHALAQAPFSSLAGEIRAGEASLQNNSTIVGGGTLAISSQATPSAVASFSSLVSVIVGGASSHSSSSTASPKGTLSITGRYGVSGNAYIDAYGSLAAHGATLLLDSGLLSSKPSVILSGKLGAVGTGTLSGSQKIFRSVAASLLGNGTVAPDVHTITGIGSELQGIGSFSPNGTMALAGRILTEAVSNITGYGTRTTLGKSNIGPFDDLVIATRRPSYLPALPKLKTDDSIFVDFPLYEGAGNIRSTTSRKTVGNIGNLAWGRVNGRMSLTSNGTSYSNNRLSFDTTGMSITNSSLFVSFKPTSFNTYNFLFNLRGTANNNNEIDIYYRSNSTVYVVIYNGTTSQTVTISGVSLNEWNSLVVTWGDGLQVSLNGGTPVTLASLTPPSVLGSTAYVGGRIEDNFNIVGSIDHFRFYNRQLKTAEVSQLHRSINQNYTFNRLLIQSDKMSRMLANGILLGELDLVTLITYINRSEGYNIDVSKEFIKGCSVSRSKALIASIDQTKTNSINIDKILETALEK